MTEPAAPQAAAAQPAAQPAAAQPAAARPGAAQTPAQPAAAGGTPRGSADRPAAAETPAQPAAAQPAAAAETEAAAPETSTAEASAATAPQAGAPQPAATGTDGAQPAATDSRTTDITAGQGGVMTDEVGVVTGDLTLRTELSGGQVVVRAQYKDADEWYTVTGAKAQLKDPADLEAVHAVAVGILNRPER
ncbi:hypothetical protein COUCH_02335 [Couchioplanes caeruleus]|uniref:hypothetical protein n=1 Tax=Couchioplanes caeruleus TaxID=56438 RepID=UPI0020BEA163|nr:hypothetical protein [Couchioplanes caeruleus]UQU65207.1 hypothetical protein COUCH_02335 [Couchioplanes caeruleus]